MFTKKSAPKILVLLLCVVLLIAGCSKGGNSAGNTGSEDVKPTDISIMSIFYQKEPPAKDNPILQEIENRTNTKLNVTWVTANSFSEKVNVTLASGEMPDLMLVTDTGNAAFRSMAQQGAFWDLTDLIKDYPNLMKFPDVTITNNLIEGKLYGVPRVRPTEGNAQPLIRKDWLDKVNMQMPANMDELYTVMKAFKEQALGGQNTIGLSGYVNQDNMGQFQFLQDVFTHTAGKFRVEDGHLIDVTFEPEMRDALEWFHKLYADGLIPQDFALLKHDQAKDLFFSGKAGIFLDKPDQITGMLSEMNKAGMPDASIVWTPKLGGPLGEYAAKGNGHYGMFVIPTTVSEDKVKKLLAFLDYGASDEGNELANYGRKDIEFTVQDGNNVLTDKALGDPSFGFMQNVFRKYDKYGNIGTGLSAEQKKEAEAWIDQAAEVSIANPVDGLVSETATLSGPDYDKKIQDLKTKVIMGSASLADWDKFTANLKKDTTYIKILEEFNQAYQARSGS